MFTSLQKYILGSPFINGDVRPDEVEGNRHFSNCLACVHVAIQIQIKLKFKEIPHHRIYSFGCFLHFKNIFQGLYSLLETFGRMKLREIDICRIAWLVYM